MKVEKVVKPPQNPVVSRSFVDGDISPLPLQLSPEKKPMMRHPKIFTVKVPKGKVMSVHDCTIFDTPYLNPPPKKLPMLTNNNSFMLMFIILSVSHMREMAKYTPFQGLCWQRYTELFGKDKLSLEKSHCAFFYRH